MIRNRIIRSTKQAFPQVKPVFIFTTKRIPSSSLKDPDPPLLRSHVIYRFLCDCGDSYIGRTERALMVRIKEHVPRWLQLGSSRNSSSSSLSSAVCRHAVDCDKFLGTRFSSYFSVLALSSHSLSLKILEAVFIPKHKPPLCVQKDRLFTLKTFRLFTLVTFSSSFSSFPFVNCILCAPAWWLDFMLFSLAVHV